MQSLKPTDVRTDLNNRKASLLKICKDIILTLLNGTGIVYTQKIYPTLSFINHSRKLLIFLKVSSLLLSQLLYIHRMSVCLS